MSKEKERKDWYEDFVKFFELPTRSKLKNLLKKHNFESKNLDYKLDWKVEYSKLARHILAFANAEGGCIIFGVEQDNNKKLKPIGLKAFKDEAELRNELKAYVHELLLEKLELVNFTLKKSDDKIQGDFQVLFIGDYPTHIPFISTKNGKNLKANTVYYRDGTQSNSANYTQFQNIIDRRIRTNTTSLNQITLKEDIEELKILYECLQKHYTFIDMLNPFAGLPLKVEKNKKYPKEDFEDFIIDMIKKKKEKIFKRLL
ncbi:ATP-binding protein [Candidatus Dojkabacteria bacterium]|nr:ATP-binding protein [Candidatus Dojkabacteria bacterium]